MRPLRLLLVERLDTRFRFNISLNRKGAVAVLAPVGVADSSSLSRRFGTRNCSGNMLEQQEWPPTNATASGDLFRTQSVVYLS